MKNIPLSRIFIMLFGIFFGMYVIMEAITSNTSILGKIYLFIAVGAFLTGVLQPTRAIYVLIFCTAYIDFFKRLMVIAGIPTNFDVACTLATPPLLCAGAVINLFLSTILGKYKMSKGLILSFVFAVALVFVGLFSSSSDSARGVGGLVNTVAYPFLLVLIPAYFPNIEDKVKLMKFIYILFFGVAIYMIKHAIYGLADFEYDYLLTNLSQEVRILWEGENMRCFSTMNGAGIVSVMCSLMAFWSFVNVWDKSFLFNAMRVTCAIIFMIASYYTLSRTGWACGIAAFACYLLFTSWKTTIAAYVLGLSLVFSLVIFSPIIKEARVVERTEVSIQAMVGNDDSRAQQATTLGTFNGRLIGWVNLMTKPHMWTPFGWRATGRKFRDYDMLDLGDDIIFWTVVKYGYIPVSIGLTIFLTFMYKLHSFVCHLPRMSVERKVSNICLATAVGIMSGGIGNAAQLSVFPINIYFYMSLAFVYSIYLQRQIKVKQEKMHEKPVSYASLYTKRKLFIL